MTTFLLQVYMHGYYHRLEHYIDAFKCYCKPSQSISQLAKTKNQNDTYRFSTLFGQLYRQLVFQ